MFNLMNWKFTNWICHIRSLKTTSDIIPTIQMIYNDKSTRMLLNSLKFILLATLVQYYKLIHWLVENLVLAYKGSCQTQPPQPIEQNITFLTSHFIKCDQECANRQKMNYIKRWSISRGYRCPRRFLTWC